MLARSRILNWLEDDVDISASTSVGDFLTVRVHAVSEKGSVTGYGYDFGDGSPLLSSASPRVTHHVADGDQGPVVVAVTDSLGHVGVDIAAGGE